MAINFKRYVDIVSGIGAGASVPRRDLIGRLFTANVLLPSQSFIEFSSASEVGDYFGTDSEEYKRAAFYFGWTSKNIKRAQKISFARWVETATAPMIFGAKGAQSIASYQPITTGSFTLTLAGVAHTLTGLDFSAVTSLNDVAAVVQQAIRAQAGTMWTAATVTWDAVRKSFDLVGGVVGDGNVVVAAGTGGNDVAGQLGWLTGAILSYGSHAESITETLTNSAAASNNFGSFLFMPSITQDQATEAAAWTSLQNVFYQFMVRVTAGNAAAHEAAMASYGGVGLTLAPLSTEYDEMEPMMILAATDYTARNSVQNYMFQQFPGLTPKVTTDADADTYDALRVNYYGRTQTAGQFLDFYQRGVLLGLPTSPADMNVFANEQWLKDAAGAAVGTLLVALPRIPANTQGRSQLIAALQSVANQALSNGTISVGKALDTTQKLYIGEITDDDLAWHQVQNIGYWLDVQFVTYVENSVTKYKATYTLVYSKDDAIRKVEGSHVLI